MVEAHLSRFDINAFMHEGVIIADARLVNEVLDKILNFFGFYIDYDDSHFAESLAQAMRYVLRSKDDSQYVTGVTELYAETILGCRAFTRSLMLLVFRAYKMFRLDMKTIENPFFGWNDLDELAIKVDLVCNGRAAIC